MARAGGITNAVNVGIAVQADWENREFISHISLNVRHLFEFLLQFDATTKSKLASLNEKLDTLERRLELIEVQVGTATANPSFLLRDAVVSSDSVFLHYPLLLSLDTFCNRALSCKAEVKNHEQLQLTGIGAVNLNNPILTLHRHRHYLHGRFLLFQRKFAPTILKFPSISPPSFFPSWTLRTRARGHSFSTSSKASVTNAEVEEQGEVKVAEGHTITQFCDKIIDFFLNEKPRVREWRKYLVFREEWNKYRERFYTRCQLLDNLETDPSLKHKYTSLAAKVKRIDEDMEKHSELLKEIQDSPTDLNAIVTRRLKDFAGEIFRYLSLPSEAYDALEDRDAMARLGTRCLSATSAFDKTLENVETIDRAQANLDDILNSPSVDAACEKIKSLAKAKELDSPLILLINSAWKATKDSTTMKNEVKEVMYRINKATNSSLRSIAPKEIKLLKHFLNIADPEDIFSALATAFCPGDEHEVKHPYALYTTQKELHKWIKIVLDAYHLNKEDTDIREAKQMTQLVVIQRLFILKELLKNTHIWNSN